MSESKNLSRRQFLGTAATAATVSAALVPRHVLGGANYVPPSEKINVACVGVGTQGTRTLIGTLLPSDEIRVVAVSDPNRGSTDYVEWGRFEIRDKVRGLLNDPNWGAGLDASRVGREPAREIVEAYYGMNQPGGKYQGCATYRDYRELLEEAEDVDAVVSLPPDHHHAHVALLAMKKGKHVITHKPMAHRVGDVRKLVDTCREADVATHLFCASTRPEVRSLAEWIGAGAIGDVHDVHAWSYRPIWPQGMTSYPAETPAVPDGLDWDLWLGPAAERPYHPAYTHAVFRGWYDFGTGALGDMGNYRFFGLYLILKLGLPTAVESSRSEYWAIVNNNWVKQENHVSFPRASMIHFEYPARESLPPVTVHWYDGTLKPPTPPELIGDGEQLPVEGALFEGTQGKILTGPGFAKPRLIPRSRMREFEQPPQTLARPVGETWIAACKGGPPSEANFEAMAPMAEALCLGNLAQRLGTRLEWDAANTKVSNLPRANEYLHHQCREGWQV